MTVVVAIVFGWLCVTTAVGIAAGVRSRREGRHSGDDFMLGGRRFGAVLLYVLMAAEIYSAYAFLGLAGHAYRHGASILYAAGYGSIAYAILFSFGPRVNRLGRRMGYTTQPDYATDRYDSRLLGAIVALVGVAALAIYLQVQIVGAGLIIELASGGAFPAGWARIVAFGCVMLFVTTSGMRGVGWTNLLQACVMLAGMFAVGIVFAVQFFGSVGAMFAELAERSPAHLTLAGADGNHGPTWYATRVIGSAIGFWLWPHIFQAIYTAREPDILRRNACVLPLYQLALFPVMIVGFSVFVLHDREGQLLPAGAQDRAMLEALVDHFPPWFAGAVAAGGLAAAVSTASALILSMATLVARNIVGGRQGARTSDRTIARVAVVPLTMAAVALTFVLEDDIVRLLLLAFSVVMQLAPAVLLGTFWLRVHRAAVLTGLAVAFGLLLAVATGLVTVPGSFYPGLFALIPNAAIVIVWSALRPPDRRTVERFGTRDGTPDGATPAKA